MTESISFPEQGLRDHVVSLRQVAARVQTSHEAAVATHLDRGAYGLCCQFMVDYFEPSAQVTVDGMATSVTELTGLATRLEAVVGLNVGANQTAADAVGAPGIGLPL